MKKTIGICFLCAVVAAVTASGTVALLRWRETIAAERETQWLSSKPGERELRCIVLGLRPDGTIVWRPCG